MMPPKYPVKFCCGVLAPAGTEGVVVGTIAGYHELILAVVLPVAVLVAIGVGRHLAGAAAIAVADDKARDAVAAVKAVADAVGRGHVGRIDADRLAGGVRQIAAVDDAVDDRLGRAFAVERGVEDVADQHGDRRLWPGPEPLTARLACNALVPPTSSKTCCSPASPGTAANCRQRPPIPPAMRSGMMTPKPAAARRRGPARRSNSPGRSSH